MSLSIHSLDPDARDSVYYTESFRRVLEDHVEVLRLDPDNQIKTIEPAQGHRYQYDFNGLMSELRVPRKYHWIAMRVNGYNTNTDFDGDREFIQIPPYNRIDSLAQLHRTSYLKNPVT